MSIEDFKMYEEWNAYRQELAQRVAEQPPAKREVVVAGWGRRFGGHLIDSFILAIPMGFLMYDAMAPYLSDMQSQVDPVTGQVSQIFMQDFMSAMLAANFRITAAFVAIAALYYIVCHGWSGQTLGKMAVGVKVVTTDGEDISWSHALKRALINPGVQIVPGIGGLAALLNGLWPLWDSRRQTIGDKVAGTIVVRS